jgi:hypothetical protein
MTWRKARFGLFRYDSGYDRVAPIFSRLDLLVSEVNVKQTLTKTCPVPADDGFGRNDDEGLLPIRPDPSGDHPEELIDKSETRARMPTFQHCELLPEHEIPQNKIPAATEETNQCSDPEKK